MLGILSVVIGFILTGIIGRSIGIKFAIREHLDKFALDKVQKDINLIEEINLSFIQESVLRKNSAEQVIVELESSTNIDKAALEKFRIAHQLAIKNWMLVLYKNNILLNSLGLASIANQIESDIHKKFSNSREQINLALKATEFQQRLIYLAESQKQLNFAFGATRRISNKLVELKESKWEKFRCNEFETEALNKFNLKYAPISVLIKSLFYRNPNRLRIRRPN